MRDAASLAFAAAVPLAGTYGTYTLRSAWPLLGSLAFSTVFALSATLTLSSLQQSCLVAAMVATSFALHIVYLPVGLCCFFALMLCKNELLLSARQAAAPAAVPAAKAR